jgi:hypothetical protein
MATFTVYTSYLLTSLSGYSSAIHCNYINSVQFDASNPYVNDINFYFSGATAGDFKFLSTGVATGTGFTANKIYMLIQLVSGTTTPDASKWKIVEVTSNISGFTGFITPLQLTNTKFKVSLLNYTGLTPYNLNNAINGLNYPTRFSNADNQLCFGDETFFLGNVNAEIHADIYTTNLSIILPLNQFNSSNNSTWDGLSSVYATEIGIFDGNGNLVAIGKFNDPVEKNSNISRTVLFAIDF